MCITFLKKLFRGSAKLTIPHPEEPINFNATIETVNPNELIYIVNKWLNDWKVPTEFHPFWLSVKITLVPGLSVLYNGQLVQIPAATWVEERRMEIDPRWANPGIFSHENCHISQTFLPDLAAFTEAYNVCSDPLLALVKDKMLGKDPTWANSPAEIHADVYRYLGEKVSEELRGFYPKLL